jgi:hypothetical protein
MTLLLPNNYHKSRQTALFSILHIPYVGRTTLSTAWRRGSSPRTSTRPSTSPSTSRPAPASLIRKSNVKALTAKLLALHCLKVYFDFFVGVVKNIYIQQNLSLPLEEKQEKIIMGIFHLHCNYCVVM